MVAPHSPRCLSPAALLCAAVAVVSPLAQGCHRGGEARAPNAEAQAIADADARLRGAWVLQSFTPDTPLEPMLAALLDFQFGRLMVRLDGKRLVADSPGIHVDRTYRVTEAKGDQFKVTTFDDQGVPYESSCLFLTDGRIEIHSTTSPWKGVGIVGRAGR